MTRNISTQDLSCCYTARQLIEELQNAEDLDAPVLFVCNYGDYSQTQQALPAGEVLVEQTMKSLEESAYSHSGIAFNEDDQEEEEEWMCNNEKCKSFGELWSIPTCPECSCPGVNEEGETYSPDNDDDDDLSIIIIRS